MQAVLSMKFTLCSMDVYFETEIIDHTEVTSQTELTDQAMQHIEEST